MVAENVRNIQQRIAATCTRVGRKPEDITLLAVTKTFSSERIQEVVRAGVHDLGENFVQELQRKREALSKEKIRWHFIGHLQSNKVKYLAEWIYLIHSVDSIRLGEEISRRAAHIGRTIDILVEVNTTGENSKFGVCPHDAPVLIDQLHQLPAINVAGLMTIGPFLPDPEQSRPSFQRLRDLKQSMECTGTALPHLSMGMSNDFEVAIEEGATIIRIGTAIFGSRVNSQ